jgi:hypothetical protein
MITWTIHTRDRFNPVDFAGPFVVQAWTPWGACRKAKARFPHMLSNHISRCMYVLTVKYKRRCVWRQDARGEVL